MPSSRTANFRLYLPDFGTRGWDSEINGNTRVLDALLAKYISLRNIQGVWENSTAYEVDQVLVDDSDGTLWAVNNNHTSSVSPTTFAQERATNPSYWRSVTFDARYRGVWETGTTYYVGDFVVSGDYYAVANVQHVAGATFTADAANWDVLVDLTGKLENGDDASFNTLNVTDVGTFRDKLRLLNSSITTVSGADPDQNGAEWAAYIMQWDIPDDPLQSLDRGGSGGALTIGYNIAADGQPRSYRPVFQIGPRGGDGQHGDDTLGVLWQQYFALASNNHNMFPPGGYSWDGSQSVPSGGVALDVGPIFMLDRQVDNPPTGSHLGMIEWAGRGGDGSPIRYADLYAIVANNDPSSPDGYLLLNTADASIGSYPRWGFGQAIWSQGVTGGRRETGSINCHAAYVQNVAVVTVSGTQSLSSKTLVSPIVTGTLSSGADIVMAKAAPAIRMSDTNGPTNLKGFGLRVFYLAPTLYCDLQAFADDFSAGRTAYRVTRSGADIDEHIFYTGNFSEKVKIAASGALVHGGATTFVDASSHLGLRSYTVATLPSAATAARLIYVSDGTANKRLAVSDGTNWRWPDGAVVS